MDPGSGQEPTAPQAVERRAHEFFDEAEVIVGDRFAEARFDHDRGLRVTVIDLDEQDTASITDTAERLGILDWIRIERADPDALRTWERLRHDLLRLQSAQPGTLQLWPTPVPGYRRPPVDIHLSADAAATAADLHDSYGEFVALRVGALPYPPEHQATSRPTSPTAARESVDAALLRVALETPLVVRSGETSTHRLLLTNLGTQDIQVRTNGHLTATVVDDGGAAVGGYVGLQHKPLMIFTARSAETVGIPVLVGTASYRAELGYAIPPGTWRLTVPLDLGNGRRLVTPALEFTITA